MDIGIKVPTPSLCLLVLLPKAGTALLTRALCDRPARLPGVGSAGSAGLQHAGATALAVPLCPFVTLGLTEGERARSGAWAQLTLDVVPLTLVVALFF